VDLQLANRIALVAASSQGLGYATALQLSREGAMVAICSRDQAHVAAAVDSIKVETGGVVFGMVGDMTRADDIDRLVQHAVDEFGGLDIVVTNAGGPPSLPFEDVTDDQWHAAFDLNLMSSVRLIRAALPHLRQSTAPAALTITSFTVKQPMLNLVLSNSIRMAVIGLTKTLALELASDRIRFNSILPGWTETERVNDLMAARAARNSTTPEQEIAKQAAAIPLGRMATPAEFANAAAFLVSPAASYINGVMLLVDGGQYPAMF
jgi:3-oxoacyl-[acyl-carrier protein] reductase